MSIGIKKVTTCQHNVEPCKCSCNSKKQCQCQTKPQAHDSFQKVTTSAKEMSKKALAAGVAGGFATAGAILLASKIADKLAKPVSIIAGFGIASVIMNNILKTSKENNQECCCKKC